MEWSTHRTQILGYIGMKVEIPSSSQTLKLWRNKSSVVISNITTSLPFVRQLNMYGFHKVPHLNHGVLHNDGLPEVWEFTNVNFHRDQPGRMRYIVRKKGEAEKARMAAKQQPTSSSFNESSTSSK